MQGEVAYWKSIAANKRPSVFVPARASLESPQLDQLIATNSRCSKTTPSARHRPSTAVPTRTDSAASSSRPTTTCRGPSARSALQDQARVDSALLHDAERVREQSRSSTPVAGILKPYQHRGSVPQAASLRYIFTQQQQPEQQDQNGLWSTDPPTDLDRARMLALNLEVLELRKQVATKDREIQRLTRDPRRASRAYLPRARSASILASTSADEATAKSVTEAQTGQPSPSAQPKELPISSYFSGGSSNTNSRPEVVPGTVSSAGNDTATATATRGWTEAFPKKNEIISVHSSAQITSPNSAREDGEQQAPEERKLSATELLAERRASYIHASAERAIERRRSQSSTPGERRGSRGGAVEGGERRLSATALLAERRASTLAAAAVLAAQAAPDLTLAASAAGLSPRRGSVSAVATPRRTSTEQTPRRGSTVVDAAEPHSTESAAKAAPSEQVARRVSTTAPAPVTLSRQQTPRRGSSVVGAAGQHSAERRGSKSPAEEAPAEQATRRVSTTAHAPATLSRQQTPRRGSNVAGAAAPHSPERRDSKSAAEAAPAEPATRRVSTTAPVPRSRERRSSSVTGQKRRRSRTNARAAPPTKDIEPNSSATASLEESINVEGANLISAAEHDVIVDEQSPPPPAAVPTPAAVQDHSAAANVADTERTDIPSSPAE